MNSQMLSWQHPQAGGKKNDLTSKDAELALSTLLGVRSAWETDDTNDVSTLDVLVLFLKGHIGLGLLLLTHDLDGNTLGFAYILLMGAVYSMIHYTYKHRSVASWKQSAV